MTPEKRLQSMPISCHGTYKAAIEGRSRAKAVKAFCQECVGYERKLVRQCTDEGCPLFPYRPYQTKGVEEEDFDTEVEESSVVEEPKEEVADHKKTKVAKKTTKGKKRKFRRRATARK